MISKANRPNSHNLNFFREWYERSDMGNEPLLDDDRFIWSGKYYEDLIALGQPPGDDFVSRWFIDNLIPFIHRKLKGLSVSKTSIQGKKAES